MRQDLKNQSYSAAASGGASALASKEVAFTTAETSVRQLIGNGKYKTALDRAKEIHKTHASAASEGLLIDAYAARIQALIAQNLTVEAKSLLDLVQDRYPAAAGRLLSLTASTAARAGNLTELVAPLNDPALSAERRDTIERAVQEQITDLAALAECAALPSGHPLRDAAAAVRKALEAVTTGPVLDDALALPEVSRRSPLAPWKLLIRAIACFYRREDDACRRYLGVIDPKSAAARLVPAIQAVLDGKPVALLSAASAELVSRITGDIPALKQAVEAVDRAFASEENDSRILNAIRAAVQECRGSAPGQLDLLKQHIAARAAVAELDKNKVVGAMGGPVRNEADFLRLYARGLESCDDPVDTVTACAVWDEFRLKAVEERWFTANGPEVATLYLHMAQLLEDVPEELIRSFEQANRAAGSAPTLDLFFVRPNELYQRACVLDPHFEALSQWMEWAKRQSGIEAERVAETWHKIRPQDIEPVLYMMGELEKRGAFAKALLYLAKAERIDGVIAEVRRARLRLLARNAIRQVQQKKLALAEATLEECCSLPQAQQGDRPAFMAALRYVVASARGDQARARTCRAEIERVLDSPGAASLLVLSVATACKRGALERPEVVHKLAKSDRAGLPVSVARLVALGDDLQVRMLIPWDWMAETAKRFAPVRHTLAVSQLRALGEAALTADHRELAYAVSAAGLERDGTTEAEFLFLRARSLPEASFERRMVCAAAAAKLAQQHRELELAGRAVDFLSGPLRDGSIEITAPQAAEVLQTEKKERAYPKGNRGPNYRSIVGELDEFDFEDDDEFEDDFAVFDPDDPFSGCQIPEDMPPEVARFLLEETKRAVLRGESLEQLMARLTARGMLPDQAHKAHKKNRRGRGE